MNNLNDEEHEQVREVQQWLDGRVSQNSSPFEDLSRALGYLRFLLSLIDSKAAEGDGYWPMIVDRGDGVKGHYCIGRLIKQREPFWEYWSKGEWGSAGEVFIGHEAAEAQLEAIRKGIGYADPLDNDAVDNELRRWQDAIRDKLIGLGAPDWKIDGAGCDSGDLLDFTLAEVGQGCGWFIDKAETAASAMREKCVEKVEEAVWLATRDFKGVLNEIQRRAIALATATYVDAAVKRGSLTLDQVQEKAVTTTQKEKDHD